MRERADVVEVEPGHGRTLLVISPHADDATIQCGGTIVLWARSGWRIVLARVTNDALDSVGVDRATTIVQNTDQLHRAAAILGIDDIIELGYETDRMSEVSEVSLRERLIRLYRTARPYGVVSFDTLPATGENNQDHIRVAEAADEAFWTAMFDKHHPEHFLEGLSPHGIFERWLFGRGLLYADTVVDVSASIDAKVEAMAAHETMLLNMAAQIRLQASTGEIALPIPAGPDRFVARWLAERIVRTRAAAIGARYGLAYAEEFRVARFINPGRP
jgi:LmbE family N-acetylglucosaminyl deacetylase